MDKLLFAISAILISGSVLAAPSTATLVNANGLVLVNQGKQFVTAQPGLLLTTGDRVMVMEGANASVRYAEGCTVNLKAGSIITVSTQQACVAGNNGIAQTAPMTAQSDGWNPNAMTALVVGGVIVATAIYINSNDNQSSP